MADFQKSVGLVVHTVVDFLHFIDLLSLKYSIWYSAAVKLYCFLLQVKLAQQVLPVRQVSPALPASLGRPAALARSVLAVALEWLVALGPWVQSDPQASPGCVARPAL